MGRSGPPGLAETIPPARASETAPTPQAAERTRFRTALHAYPAKARATGALTSPGPRPRTPKKVGRPKAPYPRPGGQSDQIYRRGTEAGGNWNAAIMSLIAGTPLTGTYGLGPVWIGLGMLSRLRAEIVGRLQLASMNFGIEAWSL